MLKRFSLLLLTLTLITGCGFHLRGTHSLPAGSIVKIDSATPFDELEKEVSQQLQFRDTEVVFHDECVPCVYRIELSNRKSGRAVEHVASDTRIQSATLTEEVHLKLFKKGLETSTLLLEQDLRHSSQLIFDREQITGLRTEEEAIRKYLIKELSSSVIRILEFHATKNQ